MKRIILLLGTLLAALWLASASYAESKPFITKWKGEAGKELKIPIFGTNYKLVIKKASDNTEIKRENSLTITEDDNFYTYTPTKDDELLVEAGPEGVEYIRFVREMEKRGSAANLLTVERFGAVAWKSMSRAFAYCKNMQFATTVDTPDLSSVKDMSNMFCECSAFNQGINNWNVSKVTNMEGMFYWCSAFNQPLANWDVSNVSNMNRMFRACQSFNQPLEKWNVSKVTNMGMMFTDCRSFNQPLAKWDVSSVTNMSLMFTDCRSFNQPLAKWSVSNVTHMLGMFSGCSAFNQPLANWDVCKVTNMSNMFHGCSAFNQPLAKWNVSNVTNMSNMFRGCTLFNQSLEIWKITPFAYSNGMRGMFFGTPAAELPFVAKWCAAGCQLGEDDVFLPADDTNYYFIYESIENATKE
ncbi:MAG: BspA family leucine-rich repeat surface protein [Bacteroides sp.]